MHQGTLGSSFSPEWKCQTPVYLPSPTIYELVVSHLGMFFSTSSLDDMFCVLNIKLEIWGKAQRESARRPKSNWKEIRGGGKISSAPKSRGPNSNALAYAERALSTQGRSTWALITLFVVDWISPNFFGSTPKGSFSSTPFRFCRCLHRFQRHSRSNSKVVVKRTKFWTFFALPNFKGGGTPKSCTCVNTPT